MNVEQSVMCALLGGLLDKNVISRDMHDAAKKQILGTLDWPECFSRTDDRKEHADGDS